MKSLLELKFDIDHSWIELISNQLKWMFVFFIKIISYIGAITLILALAKFVGTVKDIRSIINDEVTISQKKIKLISSPNINHKDDLKKTSTIIKMLENKKSQ